MKDLEIDYNMLDSVDGNTMMYQGVGIKASLLGGVCTARLLEGFYNHKNAMKKELDLWLRILKDPESEGKVGHLVCSYVCFKPQMVVAITTAQQVDANSVLLEAGFTPSKPVTNLKYGEGRELINWTYALNGFLETDGKADICAA